MSVYIAAPCLDGRPYSAHTASVIREVCALAGAGVLCEYRTLVNFPVLDEGRNIMVQDFLRTNHSHLLFWDSDCALSAGAVGRLLLADKPVVGAIGCKKREPLGTLEDYCALHDGSPPLGDLLRLRFISTQALLIQRGVFLALQAAGCAMNWFKMGENAKRIDWTEDFYFSSLARKHGFDVWGHLGVGLTHYGIKGYTAPGYGEFLLRERVAGRLPEAVTETASTALSSPLTPVSLS